MWVRNPRVWTMRWTLLFKWLTCSWQTSGVNLGRCLWKEKVPESETSFISLFKPLYEFFPDRISFLITSFLIDLYWNSSFESCNFISYKIIWQQGRTGPGQEDVIRRSETEVPNPKFIRHQWHQHYLLWWRWEGRGTEKEFIQPTREQWQGDE